MSANAWIALPTIVAIILGPILALAIQRKLDEDGKQGSGNSEFSRR